MLLHIPAVLDAATVLACREKLERAAWLDGRITAGSQSAKVKNNEQLPNHEVNAVAVREVIRFLEKHVCRRYQTFKVASRQTRNISPYQADPRRALRRCCICRNSNELSHDGRWLRCISLPKRTDPSRYARRWHKYRGSA